MGSGKGVSRVDGYAITDWNAGTVVCLSFWRHSATDGDHDIGQYYFKLILKMSYY